MQFSWDDTYLWLYYLLMTMCTCTCHKPFAHVTHYWFSLFWWYIKEGTSWDDTHSSLYYLLMTIYICTFDKSFACVMHSIDSSCSGDILRKGLYFLAMGS